MTLPEISIKRHVLAWMVSGLLVLLGIISYQRIGVDRLPYIEFPIISITTTLTGANPDIVDASITSIIESSVNTTPGMTSHSLVPKAAAAVGIGFPALVDDLCRAARLPGEAAPGRAFS